MDPATPSQKDFLQELQKIPRVQRLSLLFIFASMLILPLAVVNIRSRNDALESQATIDAPAMELFRESTSLTQDPIRKGLAMSMTQYPEDRQTLNIDWWYVWNWGCPADDPTCINMLYSATDPLDASKCQTYILFLNEPNNIPPFGGPTTPADAARRLIELEAICPPSVTQFVVGNVANPTVGTPAKDWLTQFLTEYLNQAGKPFSQILGTHCYAYVDYYNDPYTCINSLKQIRALYSGPMWVTEFNTIENDPTDTSHLKRNIDYISSAFDRFAAYTNRQPDGAPWAIEDQVELVDMVTGDLRPKGTLYASWPWPNSSPSPTPRPTATPIPTPTSAPSPSPSTAPGPIYMMSIAAEDGQVLESNESSNKGGTANSSSTIVRIGDDRQDKQYKAILSFNTSVLPDSCSISKAEVRILRKSITGGDPFTTHGQLVLDLKKGKFGLAKLEASDFEAQATNTRAATFTRPFANGQYALAQLPSSFFSSIHLTGKTQVRMYFTTDDDDDNIADYMTFNSGNATSSQPVLEVTCQ